MLKRITVLLFALMLTAAPACTSSTASEASDDQAIPAPGMVTMVDVGADRCIPCKMMAPILEEVRKEYEGRAVVAFVDVWKFPDRAEPFGVRVIPTQIFYDATGREVMRHEGFMDKDAIAKVFRRLGVK